MATKTVDVTPTWSGILPALLTLLHSENAEARFVAQKELERMARLADKMIAHLKTMEK